MKRLLSFLFACFFLPADASPPDPMRRSVSIFGEIPLGNPPDYLQMIGVQYESKAGRTRSFRASLAIADIRHIVSPPYTPPSFSPMAFDREQKGTVALLGAGMMWTTPQYMGFSAYAGPELRFGLGFKGYGSEQQANAPFYYAGLAGIAGGRFTFQRSFINAEISNGAQGVFTRQQRINGEKYWQGDGSINFTAIQLRVGLGYRF